MIDYGFMLKWEDKVKKKIVVAPNAYKGTITAIRAAEIMSSAIRDAMHDVEIVQKPMADGGDGTAFVLAECTGGKVIWEIVPDPLQRHCKAAYVEIGEKEVYAVDMSSASGYARLSPGERDIWRATSEGAGVLCRHAMERGAKRIILGVGGTAFLDAGIGLASAMGVSFLDINGDTVSPGAKGMLEVCEIDMCGLMERARDIVWDLALDVDNPLLGSAGAAAVYGPQKGATEGDVCMLEEGLTNIATLVENAAGSELRTLQGTGAGGGAPLIMKGLFNARMHSGGELVAEMVGLEKAILGADVVLTGEGCMDGQTAFGKGPDVVAGLSQKNGVPVVAVVGKTGPGFEAVYKRGIIKIEKTGRGDTLPSQTVAERELFLGTKRVLSWLNQI